MGIVLIVFVMGAVPGGAAEADDLLVGHPRESYLAVKNIDAMEAALREQMAGRDRYSFSRSWWIWDRLRCRYVDGGRKDEGAIRILRAVFRGLILDRHRKLVAKGEGDLLYLFHSTLTGGNKESWLPVGDRKMFRDLHGGGYHGGWGGAARMRIYEELVRQNMLTDEQKKRAGEIIRQSLDSKIVDFRAKAQSANNHSFGNAGGVALALKHYPNAPQAAEARAWIDRIWADFADYGDWTEWTYYPYGPIFLHGMLDIAEATGRIESEAELINSVARRCLGFVHGGGVRGNPNSGSRVRKDLDAMYANPWNVGYYNVETSSRDGHFWYRLAQHYENPEYLWAAEQVALGGRPSNGEVTPEYVSAYKRRFAWFEKRGIKPMVPTTHAKVGVLSGHKLKVPERLLLNSGVEANKPFVGYFLYEKKDEHLDNVSGHLYEYSVDGFKYLHTSGKYNNVYGRDNALRGGGTGEESLDLLLVVHNRHAFPNHPDRKGDKRDFMRRGSLKLRAEQVNAENNTSGDSFGVFVYDDYYGEGSRWTRRTVLTAEGYLVVADEYIGGTELGEDYLAGPVWHLGVDDRTTLGAQKKNWFSGPALDRAWWQAKEARRVIAFVHDDGVSEYGTVRQSNSQDTGANITVFGYRPIKSGRTERFLSVFLPYSAAKAPKDVAGEINTKIGLRGTFVTDVAGVKVRMWRDGRWSVVRR